MYFFTLILLLQFKKNKDIFDSIPLSCKENLHIFSSQIQELLEAELEVKLANSQTDKLKVHTKSLTLKILTLS